jgi:hypothetical protein
VKSNISATGAARRSSSIITGVTYRNEEFFVERNGEAVCMIVPAGPRSFTVDNLADLLSVIPEADPAFGTELKWLQNTVARFHACELTLQLKD